MSGKQNGYAGLPARITLTSINQPGFMPTSRLVLNYAILKLCISLCLCASVQPHPTHRKWLLTEVTFKRELSTLNVRLHCDPKTTAYFTAIVSVHTIGCFKPEGISLSCRLPKAVHTSLNYIIITHVFAWCEAHIRRAKRASSETNRESSNENSKEMREIHF